MLLPSLPGEGEGSQFKIGKTFWNPQVVGGLYKLSVINEWAMEMHLPFYRTRGDEAHWGCGARGTLITVQLLLFYQLCGETEANPSIYRRDFSRSVVMRFSYCRVNFSLVKRGQKDSSFVTCLVLWTCLVSAKARLTSLRAASSVSQQKRYCPGRGQCT